MNCLIEAVAFAVQFSVIYSFFVGKPASSLDPVLGYMLYCDFYGLALVVKLVYEYGYRISGGYWNRPERLSAPREM